MRSIGLSNTFLVVTPVPDEYASKFADDALAIRDQVQEVIELIPCVPKLHKLTALLRERQYDDATEDERDEDDGAVCRATRRSSRLLSHLLTYPQAALHVRRRQGRDTGQRCRIG